MIIDQLPTLAAPVQSSDEIAIERGQLTYKVSAGNSFVNKSGDTMTGNLVLKDSNVDVTTPPPSAISTRGTEITDKNGVVFGRLREYVGSSGTLAVQLMALKTVNGTTKSNYIILGVNSSGSPIITISDQAAKSAWRSALELGTSGALPITIAQGGTGMTEVESTSTASQIADAEPNITIASAGFSAWGKMAQITIGLTATSSISSGATLATIVAGKHPVRSLYCIDSSNGRTEIQANGSIITRHSIASGTTVFVYTSYLMG